MAYRASVLIDPVRIRGAIDPWIYGQFLEHIGRAVYGGVYDPGSQLADADGYRTDVLEAAQGLAPTVLRWPGGNFASGYHWRDGVGPRDGRPTRRDLAWNTIEPNTFGTEEFLAYCRRLGAAPYLNLNLSTGTIDEALGWVEYCNGRDALPETKLRRAGPHPEPHDVPIWGLGNENYGWWQHGHTTAARYAETAREWAKLLRWADPASHLVAVGATEEPDWNWTVLSTAGRFVDFLSLHFYWNGGDDMYHATLAGPVAAERDIEATWGMCLAAQRSLRLPRPPRIAVDEWNVWSRTNRGDASLSETELMRNGLNDRSGIDVRFEEPYELVDALAVASWLHVLWRHPEKVGLATQAQMVNVLAPIHVTEQGVVRHTIYHPLAIARKNAGPVALDTFVVTDAGVPSPGGPASSVAALDAAATADPDAGRLHVSLVNRSVDEEADVELPTLSGKATQLTLWHADPSAGNSHDAPDAVVPVEEQIELGSSVRIPPHAHVTLVLER